MVGHPTFTSRVIYLPGLPATFIGGGDCHVHSLLDFGEEQALSTLDPSQRGSIRKKQARFPT